MVVHGGVFLILALILLVIHIVTVRTVRDVGLPLAASIPDIEKRLKILEEQVEIARVHAATDGSAPEEFVHTYVLPKDASIDRVVAALEVLRDVLVTEGKLFSMSAVHIGTAVTEENVVTWPLSFTVSVNEDGLRTISLFFRLAGFFTVADILSPQDIRQLFLYAESENPVTVIALEQFLSADLIMYATEYQSFIETIRRSFVSPAFDQMFIALQHTSLLTEVRLLLTGGVGEHLRKAGLWPLRFMMVDIVTIHRKDTERVEATFGIHVYSRAS